LIPYELIVASASRPHLLEPTLRSILELSDCAPHRIIVHDDAAFPGRQQEVKDVIRSSVLRVYPVARELYGDGWWGEFVVFRYDDPPIRHGPTLAWLLAQVRTEFVLYAQDDHRAIRPLPIRDALGLLARHGLSQIRFNKRDTGPVKGEPSDPEAFHKAEKLFSIDPEASRAFWRLDRNSGLPDWHCGSAGCDGHGLARTLTTADHFYFQLSVWRVAAIKPIVDWWMAHPEHGDFGEHAEIKVNRVMNGEYNAYLPPFPPEVPILRGEGAWNDPEVRARVHKTYIWGGIGEKAYIEHLGADPKDWAMVRNRG